ncbi:hypothetical protein HYDPIDRAFT_117381 [Hydnomerulius pinastri MD-312]|uniref:DUF202 domain-containing protein n=1 Tax=Hydnomerulius pinastri MD-312 TaxID=994086 RepID=A0A0C9WAQ4_9AGAM|nr:hypothetical protein HYDPIDRAFT_117381 [Hydnomerulius pinastri MD-312]
MGNETLAHSNELSRPPSTLVDMAKIERCSSPDQMPNLEPLSEPHSEVSSLHQSPTPTIPPSSRTLHQPSDVSPRTPPSNFAQVMRDATAPLKLSLVLENKGNVARDHLASERTYLAYVRTSLACASAGVALVQLFTLSNTADTTVDEQGGINLEKFARPLGATVVLFGLGILILGLARYFMTQSALLRGYFPVARNSITAVAFILGSLVGIVFGALIAGTKGQ